MAEEAEQDLHDHQHEHDDGPLDRSAHLGEERHDQQQQRERRDHEEPVDAVHDDAGNLGKWRRPLALNAALSNTPPPSTHLPSPAIAQTMTIAWMATSAATRYASTLYAILMIHCLLNARRATLVSTVSWYAVGQNEAGRRNPWRLTSGAQR